MGQQFNPLISIILPVRNRDAYLGACIESIRAQSYVHWELLVYDDDSTDGTADIARSFEGKDSRIRLNYFPSLGATGRIKNAGIKEAKGEVICFMDSDDLWPSEKLQTQWQALREHPEAAFSFTNGYNFNDADGRIVEWFYRERSGTREANFFQEVCSGNTGVRFPTLMIRRAPLEQLRFREDRLFNDLSFILELARLHTAVAVYAPLFQRRCHDGNVSSNGWNSDYEEHSEAIRKYAESGALSVNKAMNILIQLHLHWGTHWMAQRDFHKARQHFSIAWNMRRWNLTPVKKILRSFYEQFILRRP